TSTRARLSAITPSRPRPRSRRSAALVSTVIASRFQALPPASASRPKPDASARHQAREFRINIMARQPDEKTTAQFSSDDSALIRELALLLDETSLTEIEIERAGLRVRVARNITVSAAMPAGFQPGPVAVAAVPAAGADLAKHPGVV